MYLHIGSISGQSCTYLKGTTIVNNNSRENCTYYDTRVVSDGRTDFPKIKGQKQTKKDMCSNPDPGVKN